MPTFDFDVTEQAIRYVTENISDMPGNAGQQALVDNLDIDAYTLVSVHIAGQNADVSVDYDIKFNSSHPEAIEEILNQAEDYFQEFSERAADILNLVDLAWSSL